MQKSNFSEWTRYELEKTFALIQTENHPLWETWWLKARQQIINEFITEYLINLKNILIYRVDDWNEAELAEQFIGPLLNLVNFNTPQFAIFAQREIYAIVGDYELSATPDTIIAQGRRVPEIPYF